MKTKTLKRARIWTPKKDQSYTSIPELEKKIEIAHETYKKNFKSKVSLSKFKTWLLWVATEDFNKEVGHLKISLKDISLSEILRFYLDYAVTKINHNLKVKGHINP